MYDTESTPAGEEGDGSSIGALALKIRQGRERLDLTQRALAQRLGLDSSAVSRWEAGRVTPGASHFIALAELFGWPRQTWHLLVSAMDERATAS